MEISLERLMLLKAISTLPKRGERILDKCFDAVCLQLLQ